MSRSPKLRRYAPALALAALALATPSAHAGTLVADAPDCDAQALSQPFAPWLDPAHYTMPNGGSFEDGAAGWTLGGAVIVAGNEPYNVHGASDSSSLSLPSGSSATSATICVGLEHPTLRFFARNSGAPDSTLGIKVHFEDAAGTARSLSIGSVASSAGWQPTLPFPVLANLLPLLPGERTPVAFEFTPQGAGGSWRIDDVYVDPYRRS